MLLLSYCNIELITASSEGNYLSTTCHFIVVYPILITGADSLINFILCWQLTLSLTIKCWFKHFVICKLKLHCVYSHCKLFLNICDDLRSLSYFYTIFSFVLHRRGVIFILVTYTFFCCFFFTIKGKIAFLWMILVKKT